MLIIKSLNTVKHLRALCEITADDIEHRVSEASGISHMRYYAAGGSIENDIVELLFKLHKKLAELRWTEKCTSICAVFAANEFERTARNVADTVRNVIDLVFQVFRQTGTAVRYAERRLNILLFKVNINEYSLVSGRSYRHCEIFRYCCLSLSGDCARDHDNA